MKNIYQKALLGIRLLLISLSIVFYAFYFGAVKHPNLLYFSVLCMWIQNLLYGYSNINKRLLFIFFHFTFFVFLMTKPFIGLIKGYDWTYVIFSDFAKNADIEKMLVSMFVSLISVWIGAKICENKKLEVYNLSQKSNYGDLIKRNMRYIALIVFFISGVFAFVQGMEKAIFTQRQTYLAYYSMFQTKLPYIVRIIASFSRYSFCFYLASLPAKRKAFLPCCLFIILAVPDLIVGIRGTICLNLLLVFFYYLLRDSWTAPKTWFGKLERGLLFITGPFALIFLGVYSDIRANRSINMSTLLSGIIKFFDEQGVTFSYMCAGMGNLDKLPMHNNYAFGGIIDYFKYGTIGRLFTDNPALGNTNSLLRATSGNSYAHHMSYILLDQRYLDGRGIGSCYINEIYADFSYIGIILFGLLLGFLMVYLVSMAKRNIWCNAILLLSFTGIIYMPRSEFIGAIAYITTMQFWSITALCYFSVYLLGRKYIHKICKE